MRVGKIRFPAVSRLAVKTRADSIARESTAYRSTKPTSTVK
jgi:hypothetical protein